MDIEGSPFEQPLSNILFLSPKLLWYMLFGLKKKIDDDGCSYFKTFLFVHLVWIQFSSFVVVAAEINL